MIKLHPPIFYLIQYIYVFIVKNEIILNNKKYVVI